MSSGSRFVIGLVSGCAVFFLLTGVQYARQQTRIKMRQASNRQDDKGKQEKTYSSPLIHMLSKVIDKTKGLDTNDKDTALDILQKADPLLKKIRAENARALQRINQPVRLRGRSRRQQDKAVEFREGV